MNRDGLSNVAQRTRQAGPSEEAARISIVSRAENLTTAKLQMHPTARV